MDGSGDLFVVGSFGGTANVGAAVLVSAGGTDWAVAKLSAAAGAPLFAGSLGGTGNDVAMAGSGNAYVTGYFEGTVICPSGPLNSAGLTDALLVKLAL